MEAQRQLPWGCIGSVGAALVAGIFSVLVIRLKPQPIPLPPQPTIATEVHEPPQPRHDPQRRPITGDWQGSFTQMMPNGAQQIYQFNMRLSQDGGTITGISREIIVNTRYFADVGLNGRSNPDGTYSFQDLVVQQSFPVGGWCAKSFSLTLSADEEVLEGTWQAPGCSGGAMRLRRG